MSMQLEGWRLTHRVSSDWIQYPPDEWPVDISEGQDVHASVIASNNGTADVTCTIKLWMEDATGATRGPSEVVATIKPGWTHTRNSGVVTLDKVGNWKLHGELWVGGSRIIKHDWALLYCSKYVPPPPEGTVEFGSVYDINETKHYYDIPVDLTEGAYIQGRHERTNTNWVNQWMRTKSWLVDPDGRTRALTEGTWVDTSPGWTTGSGTAPIVLDKPGAWIMYAEVYAQVKVNGPIGSGTLVASGAWHIIDCHEVPEHTITATAGIGGSILPSGAVGVGHGGSQAFTITANQGYKIADVRVDGQSVGAVGSYNFTNVTADHTIHATFQEENGNGEPDKYKCPYCDAWFDTEEEWETHIRDEHGEEPPGEGSDLLKYALIGGGIILVALVAVPLIKRKP